MEHSIALAVAQEEVLAWTPLVPTFAKVLMGEVVRPAATPTDCRLNASYAISCAHKMGCRVFLTWEDIVHVKPKMILTLLAAAMQHDMLHRKLGRDEVLAQLEEVVRPAVGRVAQLRDVLLA